MDSNAQLIETFYSCFQNRNYAGMIAVYHPDIEFSDPVFGNLQGKTVGAMWHMLCERGKDLSIQFSDVQTQGDTGRAHWEATYTFSTTGRRVHNVIDATFIFRDGKIIRHNDQFNLWKWTRMALGTSGVLLGWSSVLHKRVHDTARHGLDTFIGKHPEYQN